MLAPVLEGKSSSPVSFLFLSRPLVLPSPRGGLSVPLTPPKNDQGQRRGYKEPGPSCHLHSCRSPSAYFRGLRKGRAVPSAPSPSLTVRPNAGFCFRPVSANFCASYAQNLRVYRVAPARASRAALGLGAPSPCQVHARCQGPGCRELSLSCLGAGECIFFPHLFL